MCRFCECKYSFKLTFPWRKLKFCTRFHKNDVSFVAFLTIKSGTLINDHIAIVLAISAQHSTVLSNFFKKIFFFLIPTLNALFFLPQVANHYSFIFSLRFFYELKFRAHQFSKSLSGSFHFWYYLVSTKVYIFVQQKVWTLWY